MIDLSGVLLVLDAVVLERIQHERFERRSAATSWWTALVGSDDTGAVALCDVFPVLASMWPDIEHVWDARDARESVSTELWAQCDGSGHEHHLRATAIRLGGKAVMVMERDDQTFLAHQLLLQRARELRLTYDALMREIERKDVLLHTIVHDLAAPLHSIVGSLSLLQDLDLRPPAERWTEIALEAATRQRELIQTILTVFVAEHEAATACETGIALEPALRRALAEREPIARMQGVTLAGELSTPTHVRAETTRLIRILTNLVDNALRHAPRGGHVTVSTRPDGAAVRITVDDDGPGVPLELIPQLFQKLARDPRGGTGLGLYFCRITVEQWGGAIGYEARPGGGARFWFRLTEANTPSAEDTHGQVATAR